MTTTIWTQGSGPEEAGNWRALGGLGPGKAIEHFIRWDFHDCAEQRNYLYRPLDHTITDKIELALKVRLAGWSKCAVSIGWQDRAEKYWRLRLPYIRDGHWQKVNLREGSIEFGIHNNGTRPSDTGIDGIRLVVVGEPAEGSTATLDLTGAKLSEFSDHDDLPRVSIGGETFPVDRPEDWGTLLAGHQRHRALHEYLGAEDVMDAGEDPMPDAEDFRFTGNYNVESAGRIPGKFSWTERADSSSENAWRFRWHALETCRLFLKAYYSSKDDEYLFMARSHAIHWLEDNLHRPTNDERYAWYDHGTALRTLALLAIWDLCQERETDVLERVDLLHALHRHGTLLASETFVARNQPYREHNHALFQAVALLLLGLVAPLRESSEWKDLGARRSLDLVGALVNAEGVSIENSTDYHGGLARVVLKVRNVFETYGLDGLHQLDEQYEAMMGFSRWVRYPNGTSPSVGDSWHMDEPTMLGRLERKVPKMRLEGGEQDRFFPESGYAILRKHDRFGYPSRQLNFTCSAINITHKHADQLSFTVWADGIEWLADPGLYKYRAEDAHGDYFRHARAHNAVVAGGETYPPREGNARLLQGETCDKYGLIEGEHYGYEDLTVKRCIKYDRGRDLIVITDAVDDSDGIQLASWFHAGLGVAVDLGPDGDALLTHPRSRSNEGLLVVPCSEEFPQQVERFHGQLKPFAAGWIYTRGGNAIASTTWSYLWPHECLSTVNVLYFGEADQLMDSRKQRVVEARDSVSETTVEPI